MIFTFRMSIRTLDEIRSLYLEMHTDDLLRLLDCYDVAGVFNDDRIMIIEEILLQRGYGNK